MFLHSMHGGGMMLIFQHSRNTTAQLCEKGPLNNDQQQSVHGGGGGGGGASYVFKVSQRHLDR